jgi:hypothetical protein
MYSARREYRQSKFAASLDAARLAGHEPLAVDTPVVISGRFEYGVVLHFSRARNALGNAGNYAIRVTGGVNVFGKPSEVGVCKTSVLCTHVSRV